VLVEERTCRCWSDRGGSASEDNLLKRMGPARERSSSGVRREADRVLEKHGFDGLDVDLEGPAIGPDYGAFIADLAPALKAKANC